VGWTGLESQACVPCLLLYSEYLSNITSTNSDVLKLDNEPLLPFGRLVAMDGNNSLKRMAMTANRSASDTRQLCDSDYFLPSEYVDQYANEIRGKMSKGPAVRPKDEDTDIESDDEADRLVAEGDPTDGLRVANEAGAPTTEDRRRQLALCVKNWKSAAKEEHKRMWGMFQESGVFAAACRHGLLLWIMDMICSGEL
jgi:hypothetical protein